MDCYANPLDPDCAELAPPVRLEREEPAVPLTLEPPATSELPNTGVDVIVLLALGAALFFLGLALRNLR